MPWAVVMVLACTTPKGWGMTGFGLGVMFAPCAGLLLIYKLNKRVTIEMSDELAERRRQGRRIAV